MHSVLNDIVNETLGEKTAVQWLSVQQPTTLWVLSLAIIRPGDLRQWQAHSHTYFNYEGRPCRHLKFCLFDKRFMRNSLCQHLICLKPPFPYQPKNAHWWLQSNLWLQFPHYPENISAFLWSNCPTRRLQKRQSWKNYLRGYLPPLGYPLNKRDFPKI